MNLVEASDSFHRMLGYAPGEQIGRHVSFCDAASSPERIEELRTSQLEATGASCSKRCIDSRTDGSSTRR